jgi:RNA polymerase sigma-70 factor (ECF subfamily)
VRTDPDGPGAERRFGALVRTVHDPVWRFLLRRSDPETAAEVLGDVLLVLWRRLDDVPDEPLPWCYAVARRCLANARRGAARHRALVSRVALLDPTPATLPPDPGDAEGHSELMAALDRLGHDDREILRLWAWEHLEPREIALVLDLTPNAASIRLHRARGRLRNAMAHVTRKDATPAGHIRSEGGGVDR